MTFAGFLILFACAVLLMTLPRRHAASPLFFGYIYMTVGQHLTVGGLHFYAVRMLILIGVARIVLRSERITPRLGSLDLAMIVWGFVALATSVFHHPAGQMFINRGGLVLNQLGVFLLLRCFIQSREDALAACRWGILCLFPLALLLAVEHFTHQNPFGFLGGVPKLAVVREGRFRAQGPFGNPIDAGLAGALLLPFAAVMWKRSRPIAWLGIAIACAMVIFSASSTPVSAIGVICFGLWLWRFHRNVRQLAWTGFAMFCLMALVMKAPPWYLLSRIDFAGGSTGWHRAELIDQAIRHFGEWWLIGTDHTRHWMPYGLEGNLYHADITDRYIMNGVIGGLPLLICLLFTIWYTIKSVIATYERSVGQNDEEAFLAWVLGVALAAHCITFLAVDYYDQLLGLWYLLLAIITALEQNPLASAEPAPLVEDRIPTFLDSALPRIS